MTCFYNQIFFSFASWYNLTKQDDDFIYLFIVFPKSQFISQVGNHNVLFVAFACLVSFLRHCPLTHASCHFRSPLVLFWLGRFLFLRKNVLLRENVLLRDSICIGLCLQNLSWRIGSLRHHAHLSLAFLSDFHFERTKRLYTSLSTFLIKKDLT